MLIAKVWNKTTGTWCKAGMQEGGPKETHGKMWCLNFLKSALSNYIGYGRYGHRSLDDLEVVVYECKELTRIPAGEWRNNGHDAK